MSNAARLLLVLPAEEGAMNKRNGDTEGKKPGIVDRVVRSMGGGSGTDESPSATKLLKSQHDEVRELFRQYEKSGENAHATRKRLIDEASDKLEIHAELEEKIFYPACRKLTDEEARKMVGESVEEHLIVKRLIKELRGLGRLGGSLRVEGDRSQGER